MDQIYSKRQFWSKAKKNEPHHWVFDIGIKLGKNFKLKITNLIFGPNLPKNGISGLKEKEWASSLKSTYSNYFNYEILA